MALISGRYESPQIGHACCSQTWGCIKNNALYKIQSAFYLCVGAAAWGVPFKISFISAAWVTQPRKGRPLCFCAQRGNIPWIDSRGALTQTCSWRNAYGVREEKRWMEVKIMWRPTEARNTNERWRMGLWFRGPRRADWPCCSTVPPWGKISWTHWK